MTTVANVHGDVTPRARRRPRDEPGEAASIGRTNPYPFAQIPLWIVFSDISDGAKMLYLVLMAHVNEKRGDGVVWPSRSLLAKILGKTVRSITNYLNELERIGAITVIQRKLPSGENLSNKYEVHEIPPNGFGGPLTLEAVHLSLRGDDEVEEVRRSPGRKPSASAQGVGKLVSPHAANNPKAGGKPVSRKQYEPEQDESEQYEVPPVGLVSRGGGAFAGAPAREENPSSTTAPRENKPPKQEAFPISSKTYPVDERMQSWLEDNRPDMTAADVAAEHLGFIDRNYDERHSAARWFQLWRGWMRVANLRVPDGWEPDADDLAWAEVNAPDVDVDAETASWIADSVFAGRKYPNVATAWREALRDAQTYVGEDAA